jgi:hypothetical protein
VFYKEAWDHLDNAKELDTGQSWQCQPKESFSTKQNLQPQRTSDGTSPFKEFEQAGELGRAIGARWFRCHVKAFYRHQYPQSITQRQGVPFTPTPSSLMASFKAVDGDGVYLTVGKLRYPSNRQRISARRLLPSCSLIDVKASLKRILYKGCLAELMSHSLDGLSS